MWLSSLNRPSASIDQRESGGMGEEKCLAMEGSEGSVDMMSLWIASVSTSEAAWRTGATKYVACRDNVRCSKEKMGWKLCRLMRV